MQITTLYNQAYIGTNRLRGENRVAADINERLVNQAIRQWRTNNLNDEDLNQILTTAANSKPLSPTDPRFLAGE